MFLLNTLIVGKKILETHKESKFLSFVSFQQSVIPDLCLWLVSFIIDVAVLYKKGYKATGFYLKYFIVSVPIVCILFFRASEVLKKDSKNKTIDKIIQRNTPRQLAEKIRIYYESKLDPEQECFCVDNTEQNPEIKKKIQEILKILERKYFTIAKEIFEQKTNIEDIKKFNQDAMNQAKDQKHEFYYCFLSDPIETDYKLFFYLKTKDVLSDTDWDAYYAHMFLEPMGDEIAKKYGAITKNYRKWKKEPTETNKKKYLVSFYNRFGDSDDYLGEYAYNNKKNSIKEHLDFIVAQKSIDCSK